MFLALLPLGAACWLLARRFARAPAADRWSRVFVFAAGTIVLCGYVASFFGRLKSEAIWIAGESVALAIVALALRPRAAATAAPPPDTAWSPFERLVLTPMIAATAIAGALNVTVMIGTAPRTWDGLTYHLARVAYYLQHDSLDYFEANFYPQVVYPAGTAILSAYAYLTTGSERLMVVWQFLSYWMAIVVAYGLGIEGGASRRQALFGALVFALFTVAIMQATAAHNDLFLAACAGIAVYSFVRYRRDPAVGHLVVASAACGLGLGSKASFAIDAPLLLAAAIYGLWQPLRAAVRAWGGLIAIGCAALAVFTLPSGYVTAYRLFGNPAGPPALVTVTTFAGRDASFRLRESGKNVLRFAFDALSLDGLPRVRLVNRAQEDLRAVPLAVVHRAGIDLSTPPDARAAFHYDRIASAHESASYFGVLGFALVVWSVLACAFRPREPALRRLLAWMTLGYFAVQACAGLYDPWRGRFFLTAGVWAAVVAAPWLAARRPLARAYLVIVVWIACASAVTAVVLRSNGMMISVEYDGHERPSLFRLDRIGQMMQNRDALTDAMRGYDTLVPKNATVAVCLGPESFEYPLFGHGLTRRLVPINSFRLGRQPVPGDADYLIFESDLEVPRPGDVHLGEELYLRRLRSAEQRED